METLHTWWATELYPMRERDQFGVSGEFEVVLATDAQATIAALQADKGKLYEERNRMKDMLDRIAAIPEVDEGYHAPNEECIADGVEALVDEYHDCKQKLTQRTAELEEAKADRDELQSVFDLGHTRTVEADKLWQEAHGKPEVWPDLGELVGWLMRRYDDLQAELEMVKASARIWETQATNWQTVNAERCAELERVRALVKAYADAKIDFDDKRLQEDHHAWRERYNKLVEAENALLQHRQGMEG